MGNLPSVEETKEKKKNVFVFLFQNPSKFIDIVIFILLEFLMFVADIICLGIIVRPIVWIFTGGYQLDVIETGRDSSNDYLPIYQKVGERLKAGLAVSLLKFAYFIPFWLSFFVLFIPTLIFQGESVRYEPGVDDGPRSVLFLIIMIICIVFILIVLITCFMAFNTAQYLYLEYDNILDSFHPGSMFRLFFNGLKNQISLILKIVGIILLPLIVTGAIYFVVAQFTNFINVINDGGKFVPSFSLDFALIAIVGISFSSIVFELIYSIFLIVILNTYFIPYLTGEMYKTWDKRKLYL